MTEKMVRVGMVYGWRTLRIAPPKTYLMSPTNFNGETIWEPGKAMEAACLAFYCGINGEHRTPSSGSSCGFYGYHSAQKLAQLGTLRQDEEHRSLLAWLTNNWNQYGLDHPNFIVMSQEDPCYYPTRVYKQVDGFSRAKERAKFASLDPRELLTVAHLSRDVGLMYDPAETITAVVRHWGIIIPHQYGFRSQFAQLHALFPDYDNPVESEYIHRSEGLLREKGVEIYPLEDVIKRRKHTRFSSYSTLMPESEVI